MKRLKGNCGVAKMNLGYVDSVANQGNSPLNLYFLTLWTCSLLLSSYAVLTVFVQSIARQVVFCQSNTILHLAAHQRSPPFLRPLCLSS